MSNIEKLDPAKIKLARAWIWSFISSPYIPPHPESIGMYQPLKHLIELSPLITENMVPGIITKLYTARESLETTPDILTQALNLVLTAYPEQAKTWASTRLAKESFGSNALRDLSNMRELGIDIRDLPECMSDQAQYKYQYWSEIDKSSAQVLFDLRNEPAWKKQIPKILNKYFEDCAKRSFTGKNDIPWSNSGKKEYNYLTHKMLDAFEPFWQEPVFLKVFTKGQKLLQRKHYDDMAHYAANKCVQQTHPAPPNFVPFFSHLIETCLKQIPLSRYLDESVSNNNSALIQRTARAIMSIEHLNPETFRTLKQSFIDMLLTLDGHAAHIDNIFSSPAVLKVIDNNLPQVWDKHMQYTVGPFSSDTIIKYVLENQNNTSKNLAGILILNYIEPTAAASFICDSIKADNDSESMWKLVINHYLEKDGLFFHDCLKAQLADSALIKQKVMRLFTLDNDKLPRSLAVYRIDDAWSPPLASPLISLLHEIYPQHESKWIDLQCLFYDNPLEFEETMFAEVLETLSGRKGPTLKEAHAMTETLGFTIDEYIATLFPENQHQLSQEDAAITLIDDNNFSV